MSASLTLDDRGAVRILRIERPEMDNRVDGETAAALADAIEAFAAAPRARVLVLTGAGDTHFCAGADLVLHPRPAEHRYVDLADIARRDPGKPTIAALNGNCFDGGLQIAAWCDFRIAAANAEFGCVSAHCGVAHGHDAARRLATIVGVSDALYLLETGARIGTGRAHAIGLVQEVVPRGRALARAVDLAHLVAGHQRFGAICADRRGVLAVRAVAPGHQSGAGTGTARKALGGADAAGALRIVP